MIVKNGVHKETFHQKAHEGVPSHWVVFYWPEGSCPILNTHVARYFDTFDDAILFENELEAYEDWSSSQEIALATQ